MAKPRCLRYKDVYKGFLASSDFGASACSCEGAAAKTSLLLCGLSGLNLVKQVTTMTSLQGGPCASHVSTYAAAQNIQEQHVSSCLFMSLNDTAL